MIATDPTRTPEIDAVLLTFCVPTYNRSASVHRLVTTILSHPDRDIDIVVLDNGSTDDTLQVLGQVDDPRLTVLSNGQNKGALFNMVNVLNHGRGEYVVYSTDQDGTDPGLIPDFKRFLASYRNVSCGYCSFDSPPGTPNQFFARGVECVGAIAYKGRHPTGYFFRNEHLKAIRLTERFSDFDVVDLFPLEFAFAELGLMGDGAIYHPRLFTPNTGSDVVARKSATTNGASRSAFFAPAARLKLAVSYSRHIDQLTLSAQDKSTLTARVFINELRTATSGFKAVMNNEKLCTHYGMQRRSVSRAEFVGIAAVFCTGFLRRLFSHRVTRILPFASSLFKVMRSRAATRES